MTRSWLGLLAAVLLSAPQAFADGPAPAPSSAPTAPEAAAPAATQAPPPVLTQWSQRHPNAAKSLAQWVQDHPRGAHHLFMWDRHHPLRAKLFIEWFVDHPDKGFDDFVASHSDWPVIDRVMRPHQGAVVDLIAWVQANGTAAKDLETLPRGFAWEGFNELRPLWAPAVGEVAAHGSPAPEVQ